MSRPRCMRPARIRKRDSKSAQGDADEATADASRIVRRAMSDSFTAEYAKLMDDYRGLVDGIHLIRRAVDRAHRGGVLPAVDEAGKSPLQECEAIARAIHRAVQPAGQHHRRRAPRRSPAGSP